MIKSKKFSTLKYAYFIIFISLFMWAFFAFYTLIQVIDDQKVYAKLINLSGKQRMLSQKTTLIAKRYFEEENSQLRDHLLELTEMMKEDHRFITQNLPSLNMKHIYFSSPYNVDKKVQDYLRLLEDCCETNDKALLQTVQIYSFNLLPVLDYSVGKFEHEISQRTDELKKRELYIFIGTLITLILESIFIVIPTIVKLEKKDDELEYLNQNLENNLTNEMMKNKEKDHLITQQAKMSAMGDMIGNIAHQWRQPLSVISTAATGVQVKKEYGILEDEFLDHALEEINDSAQYLSQTIDTFRDFIKEKKVLKEVVLQERIEKALSIVSTSLKNHHIELINNTTKIEPINMNLVVGELSQVIINIVNNAKDAILESKVENPWVKIDLEKLDGNVKISIEDNGGGVPEDIITKVFEAYFTTKEESKGTGLGLHMSYKIVTESLHGKLSVKNTQNGACFIVELPMNLES